MAKNADSDTLRLMGNPTKSRRKVVSKDQLPYERSLYNWIVCLKGSYPRKSNLRKGGNFGIKSRRQILQGHMTPHQIRQKKRYSHERNLCAQKKMEERTQYDTLQQERCARREAWNLGETCQAQTKRIEQGFTSLLKPRQRQRLFQNLQRNENSWSIPEHQCT